MPDQQFVNLYWYRRDWFERPDLRKAFRQRYGMSWTCRRTGAPTRTSPPSFTEQVGEIDGQRVYGHMDYGAFDPSIGWRPSDAWLGHGRVADPGLPNGLPVAAGASASNPAGRRGPALPVAAPRTAWQRSMHRSSTSTGCSYAPPEAQTMSFNQAGNVAAQGHDRPADLLVQRLYRRLHPAGQPVVDADGKPKWRVALHPRGAYWQDGMKSGYQDVGAWTLLKEHAAAPASGGVAVCPVRHRQSVSLRKTLVGLTPIRRSDLDSLALLAEAPRLGGLVEFYRNRAARRWTPTGAMPDFSGMAQPVVASATPRGGRADQRRRGAGQPGADFRSPSSGCRPAPAV